MRWLQAFLGFSIWLLVGAWFVIPSSLFLQINSLRFDGEQFRFDRTLPWGDVVARWTVEVRSRLCTESSSGQSIYATDENPASWRPSAKLAACIPDQGENFIYDVSRSVLFLGVIPLTASRSILNCEVGNGNCVEIIN